MLWNWIGQNWIEYNVSAYAMFLRPAGVKIWERGEPSPEPHTLCYTLRRPQGGERSGARLKGARSKNIFHSISFWQAFFQIIINLFFCFGFWAEGLGHGRLTLKSSSTSILYHSQPIWSPEPCWCSYFF